ncbi:hypothetical protein [Moraxella bovoculi]|uniref:hypothetical protein n=1 Tax=Moraxella bovoculi TaxID=386891 RepID=UPI000624A976|nr:hypothetical protein [Moraxella bovoculi]AKG12276.1 hypothetical protein AAX07_10225 [Moraxella bovoculi]AKG14247.1 hypothetical protein AAX11_09760 [Moraxella bovoculi]
MTLSTPKIRRELAKISFSTEHARIYKANAIAHLLSYQRSVASGGEIDLSALFAVYNYLVWLCDHVHEIDDKQVLPSQRLFLAEALAFVFDAYEQQRGV